MKPIIVGHQRPSQFLKMRKNRVDMERAKLAREQPADLPTLMHTVLGIGPAMREEDEPRGPLQ